MKTTAPKWGEWIALALSVVYQIGIFFPLFSLSSFFSSYFAISSSDLSIEECALIHQPELLFQLVSELSLVAKVLRKLSKGTIWFPLSAYTSNLWPHHHHQTKITLLRSDSLPLIDTTIMIIISMNQTGSSLNPLEMEPCIPIGSSLSWCINSPLPDYHSDYNSRAILPLSLEPLVLRFLYQQTSLDFSVVLPKKNISKH